MGTTVSNRIVAFAGVIGPRQLSLPDVVIEWDLVE